MTWNEIDPQRPPEPEYTLWKWRESFYFAGRLIEERTFRVGDEEYPNGQPVSIGLDRLGTVRSVATVSNPYTTLSTVLPYGEDNGRFATYEREAGGLDDANQRRYLSTIGRFTTADPYEASGGPAEPGSWNRYAYVEGDPVNFNDPEGLIKRKLDCGTPCVVFGDAAPRPVGGGGGGIVHDDARIDPPSDMLFRMKFMTEVREALRLSVIGLGLGDCEALGQFASAAAGLINPSSPNRADAEAFASMFALIMPIDEGPRRVAQALGIAVSAHAEYLKPNSAPYVSTFRPEFRDSGTDGKHQDQAHHFAFYLQVGFRGGYLEGSLLGWIADVTNPGDRALASAAAAIGNALRVNNDIYQASTSIAGLCDRR